MVIWSIFVPICVLPLCVHTGQGDLKSLHSELHPASDKWFSLGVQLQVPVETLKCIRRENLPMTERLLEQSLLDAPEALPGQLLPGAQALRTTQAQSFPGNQALPTLQAQSLLGVPTPQTRSSTIQQTQTIPGALALPIISQGS